MKKILNNMKKVIKYVILIVIVLVTAYFSYKFISKNINIGLDFKKGTEILYEIEPNDKNEELTDYMIKSVAKALKDRIENMGYVDYKIIIENNKIRVTLPVTGELKYIKEKLVATNELSFRDSKDKLLMNSDVLETGSAKVTFNGSDPVVVLGIKDEEKFKEVTKEISLRKAPNNRIIIWMDYDFTKDRYSDHEYRCGKPGNRSCISASTVNGAFSNNVVIQGNLTVDTAENLVKLINGGKLPAKITELQSIEISAYLGKGLTKNLYLIMIGAVLLIIIYMIISYRILGAVTIITSLIFHILMFWLIVLTKTNFDFISGIPIIMTYMLFISNIIINYKSFKSELKEKNASLEKSFALAKSNTIKIIINSNIFIFLMGIVLYFFKNTIFESYASVLIIGSILSILMLLVNNIIVKSLIKTNLFITHLRALIGYKEKTKKVKERSFLKKRIYIILALLVIFLASESLFIIKLNLGIDFTGGTVLSVKSDIELDNDKLIKFYKKEGYKIIKTETLNDKLEEHTIIKNNISNADLVELDKIISSDYIGTLKADKIIDITNENISKKLVIIISVAMLASIIFLTMKYGITYGISTISAIIFYLAFIIGIFNVFKLELNNYFALGLVTIVIYLISDMFLFYSYIKEKDNKDLNTLEKISKALKIIVPKIAFINIILSLVTGALIITASKKLFAFNLVILIGLTVEIIGILLTLSLIHDFEIKDNKDKKEEKKTDKNKKDLLKKRG